MSLFTRLRGNRVTDQPQQPPSPGYEAPPRAIQSQVAVAEGDPAEPVEVLHERLRAEGAAAALAEHVCVADLSPFTAVLSTISERVRSTGGGTQHAYQQCEQMLRTAFGHYDLGGDRG